MNVARTQNGSDSVGSDREMIRGIKALDRWGCVDKGAR